MTTSDYGPGGLNRALNNLEKKIDDVSTELHAVASKIDDVRLNYVRKDEYNADRQIRRAILMWGVGIVVTIALATWTIVATRPDMFG